MNLKNKTVVIVGLARSGISAARFLTQQGAFVTIVDKNKDVETTQGVDDLIKLGVRFKTGTHILADFYKAELIIISPGVSHKMKALKEVAKLGIPIIGELELASVFINKPIIGVTGTNGKTTTVKLIEKMLINSSKKVFLGGNVGIPLIECVDKLNEIEVVIAEISSFQLDTIKKFKPTTSVLLNLAKDHMDRYSTFIDYTKSKLKIFSNQTQNSVAIFNSIGKTERELIDPRKIRGQQRPFSDTPIENGAQIFDTSILVFNKNLVLYKFDLTKSKLKGSHNRENIAAASLAALAEGGNAEGVQSAIDTFEGPAHRIETIKHSRGIKFVNDSKSTNVHATISALRCFDTPVILIIGGQSKKADFRLLKPHLSKHVKIIITIGETRNEIKSILSDTLEKKNILTTLTLKNAVRKAIKCAQTGYTILLSPACSSFDQFKNYEHRGEKFKDFVEELM